MSTSLGVHPEEKLGDDVSSVDELVYEIELLFGIAVFSSALDVPPRTQTFRKHTFRRRLCVCGKPGYEAT